MSVLMYLLCVVLCTRDGDFVLISISVFGVLSTRFGQEFKQSARARALFGLIMLVSSIRFLMVDYADTLNLTWMFCLHVCVLHVRLYLMVPAYEL